MNKGLPPIHPEITPSLNRTLLILIPALILLIPNLLRISLTLHACLLAQVNTNPVIHALLPEIFDDHPGGRDGDDEEADVEADGDPVG